MPTFPAAKDRLATALGEARRGRHHPDCRCGSYKGVWCTEQEWSWSAIVDKLIDSALKNAD